MPDIKDFVPTFFVADVRKSVQWYERVMGFRLAFITRGYAGVDLGAARIHLAGREATKPGLVYKGAAYLRLNSGVDEYVASIEGKGEKLVSTLKDHDYGMREATVRDIDGNDLYIGQPI
jgi:catechol 2,3-dioxygenase-like lactoylglutathione lyase family enzyme